jgi:hypothetical protein
VVPIKSGQPVLASCKEVAGGKTVNEIQTVSESSKHTEESSGMFVGGMQFDLL